MTCTCNSVENRVKNYIKAEKKYKKMGYSWNWKSTNTWRSTWGFFGIRVQVMETKLSRFPEALYPHIVTRWKTVITF